MDAEDSLVRVHIGDCKAKPDADSKAVRVGRQAICDPAHGYGDPAELPGVRQ